MNIANFQTEREFISGLIRRAETAAELHLIRVSIEGLDDDADRLVLGRELNARFGWLNFQAVGTRKARWV